MTRRVLALMLLCAPAGLAAQQNLGPAGGTAGQPFADTCDIAEIRVRAGWWLDGIQLGCRDGRELPIRGGTGGTAATFALQPGERITAISGTTHGEYGEYVYSLQIHTDRRTSPVFGNAGPSQGRQPFRFDVPAGSQLAGFTGRAAEFLHAVGIQLAAGPADRPGPNDRGRTGGGGPANRNTGASGPVVGGVSAPVFSLHASATAQPERYEAGRTLNVHFIEGGDRLRARVMRIAQVWSKYGNIHFTMVDEAAGSDIRVGFDRTDGHWSAWPHATDSKTMNLAIDDNTSDGEVRRVVLHEFGHAIGFIHEQSRLTRPIPWDSDKVYAYFARTQKWNEAEVDHNVFRAYQQTTTQMDEPDPRSIMHYSVPNAVTIGDFEVPWNTDLSDKDRQMAALMYPYPGGQAPPPQPRLVDYAVTVRTGTDSGAGTDVNVYMSIHGTEASLRNLRVNSMLPGDALENGAVETFELRAQQNIGEILSVELTMVPDGLNGAERFFQSIGDVFQGMDSWQVDGVSIRVAGAEYEFPFSSWLTVDYARSKRWWEAQAVAVDEYFVKEYNATFGFEASAAPTDLVLKSDALERSPEAYVITINTADATGAGTDANVEIAIQGDQGSTGWHRINGLISGNAFERGSRDIVNLAVPGVGTPNAIYVRHDGSYAGAEWLLKDIEVAREGEVTYFPINEWLQRDPEGRSWPAGTPGVSYRVIVETSDIADAGTDANVFVTLYGDKATSPAIRLNGMIAGNAFERGARDSLVLSTVDVGAITQVVVSHDNQYAGAGWHLKGIAVSGAAGDVYFPADRWLEGTNAETLTPGAAAIQYIVDVTTTDRAQAGTDANVFITIHGDKGSTPEIRLNGAVSGDAFERGQTDRAIISGPDVGNVTGIRIRHDNMYASPAWHLASVRVIRDHVRGQSWDFHHGEWLESPRPEVSLSPGGARVDIAVTVKTGTESGAGTDANVFIKIYGSNGSTGDLRLNGLISGNAFENGDTDAVTLRNQADIGEITGIDVWHDNMYAGAAWYLDSITISIPGRAPKTYSFREWLEGSSNRKERR